MPFETDGFFSPEIAKFRHAVRTTHPFRAWFDYALGLNRIGFDLLRHATTRPIDRRLFTIYGHFVRVHHTFQGALLVAERGMVSNARILVRGGIESAIALCALSKDETFVDQMIAAHRLHQRKIARVVLDNPDYAATYSEEEIAAMRAVVADVDAMEAAGDWKLKEINWADVASEHCPDLYQLLYRSTSSTALTPRLIPSIGLWWLMKICKSQHSRSPRTRRVWLRRLVRRVCCLSGPPIHSPPLLIVLMCQMSC